MRFFTTQNGSRVLDPEMNERFLRRFYAYIWGPGIEKYKTLPPASSIKSSAYRWFRPSAAGRGKCQRATRPRIEAIAVWSGIPIERWLAEGYDLPEKATGPDLPVWTDKEKGAANVRARYVKKAALEREERNREEHRRQLEVALRLSEAYRPPKIDVLIHPDPEPKPYNFFEDAE